MSFSESKCCVVKHHVVHVRVRWITETRKHCTQGGGWGGGGGGWVARCYGCSLSPGERSRNFPRIALGQEHYQSNRNKPVHFHWSLAEQLLHRGEFSVLIKNDECFRLAGIFSLRHARHNSPPRSLGNTTDLIDNTSEIARVPL